MVKKQYEVTFVPNGGTLEGNDVIKVYHGDLIPIGSIPSVTRQGYNSSEVTWWTASKEGTQFNFEENEVTSNLVLYAHWGEIKTYKVILYIRIDLL